MKNLDEMKKHQWRGQKANSLTDHASNIAQLWSMHEVLARELFHRIEDSEMQKKRRMQRRQRKNRTEQNENVNK